MCSPSKMFHSVSHFPCCIMFVIFSSVLHYLWHCMRYEAEPGLLMTALTSQPRTQRQEPGTLDTTSASWRNFSDIPYMYQILYYQQGKKQFIESMNSFWVFILLRHISFDICVCLPHYCHNQLLLPVGSVSAQWPVSRQRHSGLATSNTCRENQAVDRDKPWIYEEKLTVH